MLRLTAAALTGLILLIGFAEFTFGDADHLAGLNTAINSRDAALTGDLDKAQKKEKKAYSASLKAMVNATNEVASAGKAAAKIAAKLKKLFPLDPDLATAMGEALASMESELASRISGFQGEVAGIPAAGGKHKEKAQKAVDKMQGGLDAAVASGPDYKRRAKLIVKTSKSEKKARKAIDKAIDKAGGGGINPACPGNPLKAGETFQCLVDGVAFTPNNVELGTWTQGANIIGVDIDVYQCGIGKEARIKLMFPGVPEVKSYDFGLPASAGARYGVTFAGYYLPSTSGNITVTAYDAGTGRIQGTFWFASTPPPGEAAVMITAGNFDLVLGAL